MCFGSKSKPEPDSTDGPPVRQTVVKNPDLFRTPTFEQGRVLRTSGRKESHASGHSPSESLRNYDGGDEMQRHMSTVSPGHAPSEKRYSTNAGGDEVTPVAATGAVTDAGIASTATASTPEVKGLDAGNGVIR